MRNANSSNKKNGNSEGCSGNYKLSDVRLRVSANGIRNPWRKLLRALPTMWVSGFILQGQEKPPETNVIEVASETVITLVCPTDGKFEVSAGEFRNNLPDAPQI